MVYTYAKLDSTSYQFASLHLPGNSRHAIRFNPFATSILRLENFRKSAGFATKFVITKHYKYKQTRQVT